MFKVRKLDNISILNTYRHEKSELSSERDHVEYKTWFFDFAYHLVSSSYTPGTWLVSQGSWVRYPVWQHTFVSPSAFSRRAVVSYWRKYVHEVLVNRLGGLSLPRKSVVRLTDRPDMAFDVYRGRKTTIQYNTIHPWITTLNISVDATECWVHVVQRWMKTSLCLPNF